MPHPAVFGAIIVGGLALLGYAIYQQNKEQPIYEGYQRAYNRSRGENNGRQNAFRYSDDFDFEYGSDDDEKQGSSNEDSDRYTLRPENSQLRNRKKPFRIEENGDIHERKKVV
jgi:hypothetical protein